MSRLCGMSSISFSPCARTWSACVTSSRARCTTRSRRWDRSAGGPGERSGPDPANASDWVLDPPDDEQHGPATGVAPAVAGAEVPEATSAGEGPAIWIEIDNSRCADASTLTIDGRSVGEIAGQKK